MKKEKKNKKKEKKGKVFIISKYIYVLVYYNINSHMVHFKKIYVS